MAQCQVYVRGEGGVLVHCPRKATQRCVTGDFRYCPAHRIGHGTPPHVFRTIPKRDRGDEDF